MNRIYLVDDIYLVIGVYKLKAIRLSRKKEALDL